MAVVTEVQGGTVEDSEDIDHTEHAEHAHTSQHSQQRRRLDMEETSLVPPSPPELASNNGTDTAQPTTK